MWRFPVSFQDIFLSKTRNSSRKVQTVFLSTFHTRQNCSVVLTGSCVKATLRVWTCSSTLNPCLAFITTGTAVLFLAESLPCPELLSTVSNPHRNVWLLVVLVINRLHYQPISINVVFFCLFHLFLRFFVSVKVFSCFLRKISAFILMVEVYLYSIAPESEPQRKACLPQCCRNKYVNCKDKGDQIPLILIADDRKPTAFLTTQFCMILSCFTY